MRIVFLGLVVFLGGCVGRLTDPGHRDPDGGQDSSDATTLDVAVNRDARSLDAPMPDAALPDTPMERFDAGPDATDTGPTGPCAAMMCGDNEFCTMDSCVCTAGFTRLGGVCEPDPVGGPAEHSDAEVCLRWQQSAGTAGTGFTKSETTCDPGEVTAEAINDGMRRISYLRWLTGLGPATVASSHQQAQECALISAWNPAGPMAHHPEPAAVCYTEQGAAGAGSSNIAWGVHSPVSAVDQWMLDRGNASTMGHRRWILNPPLSNVQLGVYHGGTSYRGAACMAVFGRGGSGPNPEWFAYPPPGASPSGIPLGTWTFHANWNYSDVTVVITRLSDDMDMPVTIIPVRSSGGFGYPSATSFAPMGWSPVAGQTYRVVVTAGENSATYEVRPISC